MNGAALETLGQAGRRIEVEAIGWQFIRDGEPRFVATRTIRGSRQFESAKTLERLLHRCQVRPAPKPVSTTRPDEAGTEGER